MRKLALLIMLLPTFAFAFPKAPVDNLNFHSASRIKSFAKNYDFHGIVKLSNCSGALVKFENQTDDAKAIVMTNGHCIQKPGGYLAPGEVWSNRPMIREMKLFRDLHALYKITTTKIIYATMTGTDVAFYELNESYADIMKRTKVSPYTLASLHPNEGTEIEIISGYWDIGYSCAIDGFVEKLKEGEWLFTDSIRYTNGCNTKGGTSGSPIIERGTKTVIGINNTSNVSGEVCTLDNPCEVRPDGQVFAQKGLRYGQQTHHVYSCLNDKFEIDLKVEGCNLPK